MILAGGRVTQRASKNDIRKEAEAILIRDFRVSRKFFSTDIGSRAVAYKKMLFSYDFNI